MRLWELWDRIVCMLYPARCVLCGKVVEYDDLVCPHCAAEEFPTLLQERVENLQGLAGVMPYQGWAKSAILLLKRQPDRRTILYFSRKMAQLVPDGWEVQAVIAVPASAEKIKKRGFNQAQLLAEALAQQLGLPVFIDVLQQCDRTQAQHMLSARERVENAGKSYDLSAGSAAVADKRILLVDDVSTTGATMQACAQLLLSAGAQAVFGMAAAYTVREITQ